jgi:hypothetical protein
MEKRKSIIKEVNEKREIMKNEDPEWEVMERQDRKRYKLKVSKDSWCYKVQ